MQCGMKYTGIYLQTVQDKGLVLILENNVKWRISSILGDRTVKIDEIWTILYIDATSLQGWALAESLPSDKSKFAKVEKIELILNTPELSDIGFIVHWGKKYPDFSKKKQKNPRLSR